ncbi:Uncharacterised protein [Mycobacterium tuberculosis]|nr:Uncharacterised protein [Mycobacterium tuberculosis]
MAFGFIFCAPSAKALMVQFTTPKGLAATKPSLPVFDAAPAAMPQRYWLS